MLRYITVWREKGLKTSFLDSLIYGPYNANRTTNKLQYNINQKKRLNYIDIQEGLNNSLWFRGGCLYTLIVAFTVIYSLALPNAV